MKLPKFLDVPVKLLPLLLKLALYRYFLLDGGRSYGKTQTVARILLYCGDLKKLHIVCGREIQNTIEESVYKVLADIINAENLDYIVYSNKIDHTKNGTIFRFRGFREQGAINIKGMEGVDILWVDESQAVTKKTLDVLIPTIRKERAKVIWTMNRYVEEDPVFV
jgi:phage terminase large subunit